LSAEVLADAPKVFSFTPSKPHHSYAFTFAFKLFAMLMVLPCAAWLGLLWKQGALGYGQSSGLVWFLTGLALMIYTFWCILRSRTVLDAHQIHQSWIWDKQVWLHELVYCKLIRIRKLEWLIAPRLYVRTVSGKWIAFYAADPHLWLDFERLAQELGAYQHR
jgi:hypothetical protein